MRLESIRKKFFANWYLFGVLVLLCGFAFAQIFLALHENQTIDEGVHIVAGYSYLRTGDFRLNPEHPPLAKEIAALPLLFFTPHLPTEHQSWLGADQWSFAHQFLYESGNNPDAILFWGRVPIILMALLLAVIIIRWAFELFGKKASLVVGALFVTSPLFLTHGHLITTDVPLVLGVVLSSYFFSKVLRYKRKKWIIFTSLSIAFTISVKFSGLALFPFFVLIYLIFLATQRGNETHVSFKHLGLFFLYTTLFSVLFVLLITAGTTSRFVDDPFSGQAHVENLNRLHSDGQIPDSFYNPYSWVIKKTTFPAYPYAIGLAEFVAHLEGGHDSYFLGNYSKTGFPMYFPVAFLIKSRFGVLVLLSLFLVLFVKSAVKKKSILLLDNVLILFGVPALFFISSLTSKVNIGVRHILHVFPFVFLLIGALFSQKIFLKKTLRFTLFFIVIITLGSGFIIFPYEMAYFSEIIDNPYNGPQYLLDSNLDWGQNLKYLKQYLDTNNISSVCMVYFGQGSPKYEGIETTFLPNNDEVLVTGKPNCIAVASAQTLYDVYHTSHSWLRNEKLIDTVAYSFYIYDLRK